MTACFVGHRGLSKRIDGTGIVGYAYAMDLTIFNFSYESSAPTVKILTAVTGWDKFLHLLHSFGLLW